MSCHTVLAEQLEVELDGLKGFYKSNDSVISFCTVTVIEAAQDLDYFVVICLVENILHLACTLCEYDIYG